MGRGLRGARLSGRCGSGFAPSACRGSGPPSGWSVVSMSGSWSWWGWGSPGCCVPAVVWMLGHGALMGLTLCDAQWDEMVLAQLTRRYKAFYDAG